MTRTDIYKSTNYNVELIINGSGSDGNQTVVRDLNTGKELILDAGLKPYWSLDNTVGVCITHCHRDHTRYLSYYNIPIYGTEEELNDSRVIEQYDFVHMVPDFNYVKPEYAYKIGSFSVMPFGAKHDTPNPVHFWVAINGFRFFYSCDTVEYSRHVTLDDCFYKSDIIMVDCNYVRWFMDNDSYVKDPYPRELKDRIKKVGHASMEHIKSRFEHHESKLILGHLSTLYNNKNYLGNRFNATAIAHNDDCPIYIHL